jgi:hypothetical protein
MPDPIKPNLSQAALRRAEQNRMSRERYEAMTEEEKKAYHQKVSEETMADAERRLQANKDAQTESQEAAAQKAALDIAREQEHRKKNEIYKQQYGVDAETEDIDVLEKRGYFRVDFGDTGFQHGENWSGEADTQRRRAEYYSGNRYPVNKFLNYSDRIQEMGRNILANSRNRQQ